MRRGKRDGLRRIYRVTPGKACRCVAMSSLAAGDLFYMEEPDGEVVADWDGRFIMLAMGNPYRLRHVHMSRHHPGTPAIQVEYIG